MFSPKTRRNDTFSTKTPLFFKVWFAFLFCVVLLVWSAVGYAIYTVVTDPAIIGRAAGEVVSGFNQTVK